VRSRSPLLGALLVLAWTLVIACAAPGARSTAPAPAAARAVATPGVPASVPAAAPEAQRLPTAPVRLKVGVQATANFGPLFVAADRGYFQELGLDVELVPTSSVIEQLPALAQGQLQVGACTPNLACLNFLNRRADLRIVTSLQSAGQTERSSGSIALVARKDLYDNGTIREARDLVGRTVYLIGGEGSVPYIQVVRWLQRHGVDPKSIEATHMIFPDVFAAMQNGGIEVGYVGEPFVTLGNVRGVHQVLATMEDMDPHTPSLYIMYWSGIDRLGDRVGERWMVAYLRAVRAYLDAFEYGRDLDTIIDVLIRETPLKDAALYRQIKYSWVDPDGHVSREAIEADGRLLHELGLLSAPPDLSQAFDDRYRQFAVQYLGPYQPPR